MWIDSQQLVANSTFAMVVEMPAITVPGGACVGFMGYLSWLGFPTRPAYTLTPNLREGELAREHNTPIKI